MTTPEGHTLADLEEETYQGNALADAAVAVPHRTRRASRTGAVIRKETLHIQIPFTSHL
jgi:hypothetical protein